MENILSWPIPDEMMDERKLTFAERESSIRFIYLPACSPRSTSARRDGFGEAGRRGKLEGGDKICRFGKLESLKMIQ